jgi:hypothetical protein
MEQNIEADCGELVIQTKPIKPIFSKPVVMPQPILPLHLHVGLSTFSLVRGLGLKEQLKVDHRRLAVSLGLHGHHLGRGSRRRRHRLPRTILDALRMWVGVGVAALVWRQLLCCPRSTLARNQKRSEDARVASTVEEWAETASFKAPYVARHGENLLEI